MMFATQHRNDKHNAYRGQASLALALDLAEREKAYSANLCAQVGAAERGAHHHPLWGRSVWP